MSVAVDAADPLPLKEVANYKPTSRLVLWTRPFPRGGAYRLKFLIDKRHPEERVWFMRLHLGHQCYSRCCLATSNQSENLTVASYMKLMWRRKWPSLVKSWTSLERNITGRRRVLSAWSSAQEEQEWGCLANDVISTAAVISQFKYFYQNKEEKQE